MGVMEGTNNLKPLKRERAGYGKGRKRILWLLICAAVVVSLYLGIVLAVRLGFGVGDIVKDWQVLKTEIDALDALVDPSVYPRGMSVDDVLAVSSAESQATTERLGAGRNVYVLATDPKLQYLLANYHDRRYEQYPDHKPDSLSNSNYRDLNNPLARAILGVSEQQWGRAAVYLRMKDDHYSAAVEIYGRDKGRNVVFLRRESTAELLKNRELPYATPLRQVNLWSLPHELGHSWDFGLTERQYGGKVGGQVPISADEADLIAESIADLTTALILLRETGNDDTLKYQILPFRTGSVMDHIHATQYLLGKTYVGFTHRDVVNKSDLELSSLAIAAIEKEVIENPRGLESFLAGHKGNEHFEWNARLIHSFGDGKGPSWLAEQRPAATSAGRLALENTVNNLAYHDEAQKNCPALLRAIHDQIRHLGDRKLEQALEKNRFHCDDPAKQADALKGFVTDAGFKIDWSSHERLKANLEKVEAYYQTLVALPEAPSTP